MATGDVVTAARGAGGTAKHAAANPWVQLLERIGYVFRGLLYVVMGFGALGVAAGTGGQATDQKGSLVVLAGHPLGRPVLLAAVVGLAAYSLWGFVRAVFDPLQRGSDASGIVQRLGFAWSGFAYASLAVFALQFMAGGAAAGGDGTQTMVARILAHRAGGWLTIVAGLVAIAAGLGQFVETYKARFRQDLKRGEMNETERRLADGLGRFGAFSRGITFTLVGWFLVEAGIHHDAGRAHGFGGAFTFLLSQPYGHLLVATVALGFVALGLHSFAAARWIRLMGEGR